ncbi:hypothetical protein MGWOODY_Clf2118 [hydrothermal vent metagenome]|uniref:Uncharacterized protein n=1 Tax=hydrothermal vent metagenome TaxID=652676 RepID=A0A160VFL7_9ZZZZ
MFCLENQLDYSVATSLLSLSGKRIIRHEQPPLRKSLE